MLGSARSRAPWIRRGNAVIRRRRFPLCHRHRAWFSSAPRSSSEKDTSSEPILRPSKVLVDESNGSGSYIQVLELNRPKQYNALSFELLFQLKEALISADASYPDCRAVVLKSSNDKAFSAGHDLRQIHEYLRDRKDENAEVPEVRTLFDACEQVMTLLPSIRPVTIAQCRGVSTAAGCQLVAACDLAVAADTARFAISGITVGLVCSTPVTTLAHQAIPHRKKCLEMLLTGDFIDADQAREYGLVNRVVPSELVEAETLKLARRIALHSSYATARGKDLFNQQQQQDYKSALQYATDCIVRDICQSKDAAAGIAAFAEKQQMPEWQGR